ncbi:MAG: hypothetical protein H0U77_03165 [Nocardioidaceae bacterium]|jgi:hypothetical protein|nr:hypothetical protein [Nocardioidaceae bacterium]
MAWTWRLEDDVGSEVSADDGSPSFPSQSDAESWLGEQWPELLEAGVTQVVLQEGDRRVYGPMGLRTPGS